MAPCDDVFRVRNIPARSQGDGGFDQWREMTKLESYISRAISSPRGVYSDVEGHPDDPALAVRWTS